MKMKNNLNNKKGFTIIEMIIALVIISVILLVVVPVGQTATDNSRVANAVASIKAIQTAAVNWANDKNGGQYAGISFANLAAGYLPSQFSATSTNPWGGDYTVIPNTNDSTMIDIGLKKVPASLKDKLLGQLTKISSGATVPNYDPASQTFTITLQ